MLPVFSALLINILLTLPAFAAAPTTFSQAKVALKKHIYFDQNNNGALGTIYCGCDWQWVGQSGGQIEAKRCGYTVRAIPNRGQRTEVEHIFAASHFGQQRQCWQSGGRKNCNKTDPVFNLMEADLHNLTVSIGELNADRSNYRFGTLPNAAKQHGQCQSKVDFKQRVFEPRDEAKGKIARINFYMADRYDLRLSEQQQKLFMAWSQHYPVTPWELERDQRIARIMGHHNKFVTGEKTWRLGYRNSRSGVVGRSEQRAVSKRVLIQQAQQPAHQNKTPTSTINISHAPIRGNRNSKIFHPKDCSTYNSIHLRNIVDFNNESEAVQAGYRKAKNCR